MKKVRTALAMLLAISVLLTGMVVYAQDNSHVELYASNQNITNGTFRINRIGDTLSLQGFLYNDEELWDVDFFWTSSNSNVVNITGNGSSVTLTAISAGTARITATTIDMMFSAYVDIIVGEQQSEVRIPYEAFLNLPSIGIENADHEMISDKTTPLQIGEEIPLALALESMGWTSMNISYQLVTINVYAIQDQFGNYYFIKPDTAVWSIKNKTSYASLLAKSTTATVTGQSNGTSEILLQIPCNYLIAMENGSYKDVGTIATLSTSATFQVSRYKNPFTGLDISKLENPFSDMQKTHWAYEAAISLYAAGILDGVNFYSSPDHIFSNDRNYNSVLTAAENHYLDVLTASDNRYSSNKKFNFYPNAAESRGNTVVSLYNSHRAIGGSVGSYSKNPFSDVYTGDTYYQQVLWASFNDIIKGYGDGKFGPNNTITREQFCTIIARYAAYAGKPLASAGSVKFTDASQISTWAKDAVARCAAAGLVVGNDKGAFMPKDTITRAAVCEVVKRLIEYICA